MFLDKYVSDETLQLIKKNYNVYFLNNLDEKNFQEVYALLNKYNCYFIEDLLLNYLELFTYSALDIEEELNVLKEELGSDYINIIGDDLLYIDEIIEKLEDREYI